jgi:hypothetical protein
VVGFGEGRKRVWGRSEGAIQLVTVICRRVLTHLFVLDDWRIVRIDSSSSVDDDSGGGSGGLGGHSRVQSK